MSALGDPIIIAGTTATPKRYVQFWSEHEKVAGREVTVCLAEMNDGKEFAPDRLAIRAGCPDEWLPSIWAAFESFRQGGVVTPTHTVEWTFGKATFTSLTPIPERIEHDDAPLFELEAVAS